MPETLVIALVAASSALLGTVLSPVANLITDWKRRQWAERDFTRDRRIRMAERLEEFADALLGQLALQIAQWPLDLDEGETLKPMIALREALFRWERFVHPFLREADRSAMPDFSVAGSSLSQAVAEDAVAFVQRVTLYVSARVWQSDPLAAPTPS